MEPNRVRDESAPNEAHGGTPSYWERQAASQGPLIGARVLIAISALLIALGVVRIVQGGDPENAEISGLGVAFAWLGLGLGAFLAFLGGFIAPRGLIWRAVGTAGGLGYCAWLGFGATQDVPLFILAIVAAPFVVSVMVLLGRLNPPT